MRDPTRIDRILEALGAHWRANPDLRLGQIVVNASRSHPAYAPTYIFQVEDDLIEAALDEANEDAFERRHFDTDAQGRLLIRIKK